VTLVQNDSEFPVGSQVYRICEILRDLIGDHLFLFQGVHGHAPPQRYCSVGLFSATTLARLLKMSDECLKQVRNSVKSNLSMKHRQRDHSVVCGVHESCRRS
jgi:hypothetical protein